MRRIIVFLGLWALAGPAFAVCPGTASDCPSVLYNSVVVGPATGGNKGLGSVNAQSYYLNGTLFTGSGISGPGTTVSGFVPLWSGTTGAALSAGFAINAGAQTALGSALNGSGGLLGFSIIGTSGGTLGLLNAPNTWSGVQSFNDGDLSLKGSSSGNSVLHAPATGGGAITLPVGTANLGYQVGAISTGNCLQASGTAGGFADAGAPCGSGGTGITQLTGGVTAGPGSGSQVGTLVLTAGANVTGILAGANGGTGIANTGKTLTLGGSLTTTGAATPTLAFGASTFTYTFPGATANLGYQVGSITTGHCLQASGTAGGIADAGAACGSGGSLTIDPTTPNLVITGSVLKSAPPTVTSSASTYTFNGTGTSGTGAVIDNTSTILLTAASPTFALGVAGATDFAANVGGIVMADGTTPLTITSSSTICGQASPVSFDARQPVSFAAGSGDWKCMAAVPATIPSGTIASGKNVGLDSSGKIVTATVSGLTLNVAGTSAMGTSAIPSGSCATVVTTSATGVATTDVVGWGFNGDPTGITGFTPVTTGMLTIVAFPSANNVNFKECNVTTASITPGAHTLNWRVVR